MLTAITAAALAAPVPPAPAGDLVSLATTLEPLVEHFNAGAGTPRVVALLSATCPACVFGAEAVRSAVLQSYPEADLAVSIVWIDMLARDNAAAARTSARIFDDPRVKQFHDPNRKTGRGISKLLLFEGAGPAWDIYLFYGPDAVWGDTPPEPRDWYHQLGGGRRAEPARYRTGDDLVGALREATGRLVAATPVDAAPPSRERTTLSGSVLRIEGMRCAGCARTVRAALAAVPGVAEARVDLETGLAWVRTGPGSPPAPAGLIEAVRKAGFQARVPEPGTRLEIPADLLGTLRVDVLCLPECPNADAMCVNLAEACRALGRACRIRRVNLLELPADDPRRGWGSPTALVDEADLMGLEAPPGTAPACRIYPGGTVPTPEEIAERLKTFCGGRP